MDKTIVQVIDAPEGEAAAYATKKLTDVVAAIEEPVLFTRVRLTQSNGGRARPAIAQATLDVNGDIIRAQVAAKTMFHAIDVLEHRLRAKLSHRAEHRRAKRRDRTPAAPGEWRHTDLPADRPEYFDRPREERQLVRRKTWTTEALTPEEAEFDLSQLDYDFYLFRDLRTGWDALIERTESGIPRLTYAGTPTVSTSTVEEVIDRLDATGERFVFFTLAETGRGAVVYRRYDGHYGLVSPD